MAEGNVYASTRLARLYAYCRPPVHREVVALVERHLRASGWPPPGGPAPRALDIGCGAGLSTAGGAESPRRWDRLLPWILAGWVGIVTASMAW